MAKKVQEIKTCSNVMYKPKKFSYNDVRKMLILWIMESDGDDFCATVDHVFGTMSVINPETDEVIITPVYGYSGEFGRFEKLEFVPEPCKCGKPFNPELDSCVSDCCKCGIKGLHWHCGSCGCRSEKAF
ncbi:MAG: hypothetical protein HQK96_01585 [Nitrospirae bacterium]|nr:hypothetical protein [Nitrospirota bacterium]